MTNEIPRKEKLLKTQEEILNQMYISPSDLKTLVPSLGIETCRRYIEEIRAEMKQKNLYVPPSKPRLALTKLVRKKCGF